MEVSADARKTYSTFDQPVITAVRLTRERIYPRTKDPLSIKHYSVVIQALLYAAFLHAGFPSARELFCRVSSRRTTNNVSNESPHFAANVNYPQILQEFTQQDGGQRPTYDYFFVDPSRLYAPTYRCRASFQDVFGEGLGSIKRQARHKAAHELMAKLMKAQRNGEFSQE